MKSALGICIGAATVKVAELTGVNGDMGIGRTQSLAHDCDIQGCLSRVLGAYPPASYPFVCVTGRKYKDLLNLPMVTEPEAVEAALQLMLRNGSSHARRLNALLSLGAENFIVYELNPAGAITGVRTGNKCRPPPLADGPKSPRPAVGSGRGRGRWPRRGPGARGFPP